MGEIAIIMLNDELAHIRYPERHLKAVFQFFMVSCPLCTFKEYIWLMADQAVITGPSINQAIGNRDVCISIIIPKSSLTSEEYQHIKRLLRDKLELKLVPDENVKIGIAMNEKIAGIAFPDLKGKMDFNSGFTSGSNWCVDLFSFYSNRLKKLF